MLQFLDGFPLLRGAVLLIWEPESPIPVSRKRGQLFIRMHNEALSVAAMRVSSPDRSAFAING